jgi:DNA invertase Pin-like site-specific DNA recombinase
MPTASTERVRAYCYVRVSDPTEDANGLIEKQISELANIASAWRITADRFYADRGVWLYEGNPRRPPQHQYELDRLFTEIAMDPYPNKVIFATRVDRITRNRSKGEEIFDRALKLGVPIVTLEQRFADSKEDRLAWREACIAAEALLPVVSTRTQEGMSHARERGQEFGSPPWGMKYSDEGRWIVDEEFRPSVEKVVALLMRRKAPREIINEMSTDPIWTFGKPSRRSQQARIRALHKNVRYAGYSEVVTTDEYIGIRREDSAGFYSIEDFFQLQLIHPRRQPDYNEFYLLRRLKCGRCGQQLLAAKVDYVAFDTGEIKFTKVAYLCRKKTGSNCEVPTIHNRNSLHEQFDGLVRRFGGVIGDPKLYETWSSLGYFERMDWVKSTFNIPFTSWDSVIEDPGWK